MTTSYDVLYSAFFRRIEEDKDFFQYLNLTDAQAMQLARARALGFLHEACARLAFECQKGANFLDYSDVATQFNFELSKKEIHLVAAIMYEIYLNRDIAKLKCMSVNFTSTDLKVFDPSNARTTFMTMYYAVKSENDRLIDSYRNTESDGSYIEIDFSAYDE